MLHLPAVILSEDEGRQEYIKRKMKILNSFTKGNPE
jgi:hypothetical protein